MPSFLAELPQPVIIDRLDRPNAKVPLKPGAKVLGKWKGENRFFPGRVIRTRSNGSIDIR